MQMKMLMPIITDYNSPLAVQVDNEYSQTTYTDTYFEALENVYHLSDIVVPLTFNDPGQHKDFVNGSVRIFH